MARVFLSGARGQSDGESLCDSATACGSAEFGQPSGDRARWRWVCPLWLMSYEKGLPRILSNQGEGYQNTILFCCMLFFVGYPTIAMLLWCFLLFFRMTSLASLGTPHCISFFLLMLLGKEPQWSAICRSFIPRDISNLLYIYIYIYIYKRFGEAIAGSQYFHHSLWRVLPPKIVRWSLAGEYVGESVGYRIGGILAAIFWRGGGTPKNRWVRFAIVSVAVGA